MSDYDDDYDLDGDGQLDPFEQDLQEKSINCSNMGKRLVDEDNDDYEWHGSHSAGSASGKVDENFDRRLNESVEEIIARRKMLDRIMHTVLWISLIVMFMLYLWSD